MCLEVRLQSETSVRHFDVKFFYDSLWLNYCKPVMFIAKAELCLLEIIYRNYPTFWFQVFSKFRKKDLETDGFSSPLNQESWQENTHKRTWGENEDPWLTVQSEKTIFIYLPTVYLSGSGTDL